MDILDKDKIAYFGHNCHVLNFALENLDRFVLLIVRSTRRIVEQTMMKIDSAQHLCKSKIRHLKTRLSTSTDISR